MNDPRNNQSDMVLLVRMIRYRGWLPELVLEKFVASCARGTTSESAIDRLVAEGQITDQQAEDARRFLKEKSRALHLNSGDRFRIDRSFGQIALERGWVVVEDLERALLEQERLRRVRLNFRIGEVLVRLGAMEVEQVREILREQGFDLSICGDCDTLVEGGRGDAEEAPCPQCGGALHPPVFLDLVPADRRKPHTT